MLTKARKASIIGIFANSALFLIKIIIGLLSNSIALISEAVNSFTDIITSFVTFYSVKIAAKKADKSHPFGHKRAEPVAGLIIAVFAFVLGIEVIRAAVGRIFSEEEVVLQEFAILVLLITIIVKTIMAIYFKKIGREERSPVIFANAIDCRNDILVAFGAIVGVAGTKFGYNLLDPIAALFIAAWIIKSGYNIGKENINYLVGGAPPPHIVHLLKDTAKRVRGVKNVHDIKAHFVGNCLHVELHIVVDDKLPTIKSHTIGEKVQKAIEGLEIVERAFVHIDPFRKEHALEKQKPL